MWKMYGTWPFSMCLINLWAAIHIEDWEGYNSGGDWQFERIALKMDQIRELNPPSDPAKPSDSRGKGYIKQYGDRSWELDALSPATMNGLIMDSVTEITDDNLLYEVEQREQRHKETMQVAIDGMDFSDDEA
ncbi:MAG TPA: hypothetical protein ENI27_04995 [bacterium]|nr:hypothetical protein [bacterium]